MWQHLRALMGLLPVARFPQPHALKAKQKGRALGRRSDMPTMFHAVEPLESRVLFNGHPIVLSVQINASEVQRSMLTSVVVQFSDDVSASLDSTDLQLWNLTTEEAVDPANMAVNYNASNQTATFTFPSLGATGQSLPNGDYTATLDASSITGSAGQTLDGNADGIGGDDHSFHFYRLFGDLDGDRDVDSSDLFGLHEAWRSVSTQLEYNPALDSDGDGDVDSADLFPFHKTFGTRLDVSVSIIEFGSLGNDDDEFDKPTGLAISAENQKFYVVDSGNNRVQIFELTHGDNCPPGTDEFVDKEVCFEDSFGSSGSTSGKFDVPTGVAIDRDNGDVYVVDSDNNRVQRFQSDGDFDNLEFGSPNSFDDEYLGLPSAIAVHRASDNVYVADSTTDSISVFDDSGSFLFNFGDTGSGDNEFRNPSAMVIDDASNMLYVADTDNDRIQMFELTDGDNCSPGTDELVNDEVCFVGSFGSSGSSDGKFDEPSGLAFDAADHLLYVADTENDRIQVFELSAGNTCPTTGTHEVAAGVCYVDAFGSAGSREGQFNEPSGLAIDPSSGALYVADTGNHRIQILSIHFDVNHFKGNPDVPDVPANVSASPVSSSSIAITWTTPRRDSGTPEVTGYKIEVLRDDGSYVAIVENTKSTFTSYVHTGLEEGKSYHYRVSAINSEGASEASTLVTARPEATQAPTGLIAFPISGSQIYLTWHPPTETFSQSITGYVIKREIILGVLFDTIAEVSGSTTSYTVSNLLAKKRYSYVVSAKLSLGATPESNTATATPDESSKPPTPSTLSFRLTEPFYRSDEQIAFTGRQFLGLQSVFVIIRDASGFFKGMVSDPVTNPDGIFNTLPRPVDNFFGQVGIYEATVFTDDQTEADGVTLQLFYDGGKVFATSSGVGLAAVE